MADTRTKTYTGHIVGGEHIVTVLTCSGVVETNARLDPRFDLRNHSPDGFCWGYDGSGPAQLALAILADYAGPEVAQAHYQDFKRRVIARLDQDKGFTLTENDVADGLARSMHVPLPPEHSGR